MISDVRTTLWGPEWGRDLNLSADEQEQLQRLLGLTENEMAAGVTLRIDAEMSPIIVLPVGR